MKNLILCSERNWIVLPLLIMGLSMVTGQVTGKTLKALKKEKDPQAPMKHYVNLYNKLKDNKEIVTEDCKIDSSEENNDHRHWGTLETLEFLSGKRSNEKRSKAEKRMNLTKLRYYLNRIGYSKDPGSLVFVQKQVVTLKLVGCPEGSIWRKQGGGKKEDKNYQGSFTTGPSLKQHTDQPWSYINKYTCFDINKLCFHTFYVITKISPDLPSDLMVREGATTNPQDFTCGVPYCTLRSCDQSQGVPYHRRSNPPYLIFWDVPTGLKPLLGIDPDDLKPPVGVNLTEDLFPNPFQDTTAGVKIEWNLKRKSAKDASHYDTDIGESDPEWVNSFGIDTRKDDRLFSAFSSSFSIKGADPVKHIGVLECVIMDGNGVVSTPNLGAGERVYDYVGDVNVHVLPSWQLWGPVAVSVVCILLVFLIICCCPKKMEHDDGTRYTKDELVVPVTNGPNQASVSQEAPAKPAEKMEKVSATKVEGENKDTQD